MQTNKTSTLDQLQDMCIVHCDICHFLSVCLEKIWPLNFLSCFYQKPTSLYTVCIADLLWASYEWFLIFHQVFAMLKLTPYDLSVDRLDVHAVSVLIQYCICYLSFLFFDSLSVLYSVISERWLWWIVTLNKISLLDALWRKMNNLPL